MLEILEQYCEDSHFEECPWCHDNVNVEAMDNVYDIEDHREQVPFCCDGCLECYLEKNEDIYQLIRLRKI